MAIPSRQIGWSTTDNLLWEISKQLQYLTQVIAHPPASTTTTTTTVAPTTTTTTTAPLTLYLANVSSGANPCTPEIGPIFSITSITFNGGTGLCDSSSLDSSGLTELSGGQYLVSDGINVRTGMKNSGAGITLLTFGPNVCSVCP